ncbi:MAG: DUF3373 family protein [Sulfurovum sp.]|nr:DUF3373 family protein [Sulfurovum sp.]
MKKIVTASLVAAMALTTVNASSLENRLSDLETELADVKKKLKKQNRKINKVKAHDAGDNIKWGVDLRTAMDVINYDLADGTSLKNDDLMSLRLWLNMEYAPDENNVFKGQLSMNKAFGADFTGQRGHSFGSLFDWIGNEALTDNALKVRQAYWLYLGEEFFGAEIPWTFSLGRRPSTGGFLANLREDDVENSPLGHVINVEFDGLSSKIDLSTVTGIQGMSFKVCMGKGSTNARPVLDAAQYATSNVASSDIKDINLGGVIFEPYNDGQFITKASWYRGYNVPDANVGPTGLLTGFSTVGDMEGAAFSILIDGLAEDGFLSDTKIFGSFAWTKSHPNGGTVTFPDGLGGTFDLPGMLGSTESETGTSFWVGAVLPVVEDGVLGLEYNHGSEYWRPFTYAEDTMSGSKLAARGDAYEAYFTYQLTEALSAQIRYTQVDYEYTGSLGFFGSTSGQSQKISDVKAAAAAGNPAAQATLANIVETSTDARFYIRYRF